MRHVDADWLDELARCGTEAMVRCALACIEDSFGYLQDSAIVIYASPIVEVARDWAICPCERHAKLAHGFSQQTEQLADKAEDQSTEVGDWWSCEAVESIGFVLVAIAQHHNLIAKTADFPDPPEELLKHVCGYFLAFPYNRPRDKRQTLLRIRNETLQPWAAGREPLDSTC